MISGEIINLITIGVGILGSGFVGYFIKYFLDKRQQFITKNAEFKRAAYMEVIDLLMVVLSSNKLGEMNAKEVTKRLNSAYGQCILYASPEVINAFGDTMQYIYLNQGSSDTKKMLLNMTRIFKYMRDDLGLSNKDLGIDAEKLMRVRINDYSDYFNA